jgi:hypothetical protein
MEIQKIKLNDETYRLFHISIDDKHLCVAEEKLEKYIQNCIEDDTYHKVEWVDELYGYYVDQTIADAEDEEKIIQSIIDIVNEN